MNISSDVEIYRSTQRHYSQLLKSDMESYANNVLASTRKLYGNYPLLTAKIFFDLMNRPSKHIRGGLVMAGYKMCGGEDSDMIIQAARAIEMLHTYILIVDDIQDKSVIRRGGPTAHVILSDYHTKHGLRGNSEHFGTSLAINAALSGAHAAQTILANLPASEENRIKVVSIVNRTMLITAYGQTDDIANQAKLNISDEDLNNVLERKTALYSFINPLHVGMVLANADCSSTDAITPFARHLGRAFQMSDDLLGVFGTESTSGKSSMDDIREGKRTLLIEYALSHSNSSDKDFMLEQLGNSNLSVKQLEKFRNILESTGALKYIRTLIQAEISKSLKSLNQEADRWESNELAYLKGLAEQLVDRQS